MRVEGVEIRVWREGSWCKIQDSVLRVKGLGYRIWGLGFEVEGLRFRV